jgi:hypothetical protein
VLFVTVPIEPAGNVCANVDPHNIINSNNRSNLIICSSG